LAEQTTSVDGQAGEGHTFGTHLKGQYLDRVESLEWGKTERVHSAKDEDHGDCSLCCGRFRVVRVLGSGGGHANPDDTAADHGEEHEWASSDLINECCTDQRKNELEA